MDFQEIDAASSRGVDDTKQLLETVMYMPSSSRYKVYLLDEVHMLSPQSFNMLLKTLEEPPEHVKEGGAEEAEDVLIFQDETAEDRSRRQRQLLGGDEGNQSLQ